MSIELLVILDKLLWRSINAMKVGKSARSNDDPIKVWKILGDWGII